MHGRFGFIASAAKDKTVAFSTLAEDGRLCRIAHFQGFHRKVAKCVHVQDENVLASAGDCEIFVFDKRSPTPSHHLENVHSGYAHSVRWSPTETQYLATAGLDPYIHLYDVRHLSHPVFSFRGHSAPGLFKFRTIIRPEFHSGGNILMTGGEKSVELSLYNIRTGTAISRGTLPPGISSLAPSTCSKKSQNAPIWAGLMNGEVIPMQLHTGKLEH